MAKTKYKHRQVMKLRIMTEEDVFNDKTATEELSRLLRMQLMKRFYFELINPQKKEENNGMLVL